MKKNYIAPSTEMATWASMGLMQQPGIAFATNAASGGAGETYQTLDNKDLID